MKYTSTQSILKPKIFLELDKALRYNFQFIKSIGKKGSNEITLAGFRFRQIKSRWT